MCVGNAAAKATVCAAGFFVVTALAGGGVGGATTVSGSVSEYAPRAPSSSEPNVRPNRGESEARARGIADSVRVTTRLQKLGYRVKFQAQRDDKSCAANSDGKIHDFFVKHECLSLYRQVFEVKDKYNVYLLAMATIVMPDVPTAIDLQLLLDEAVNGYAVNGKIKLLIPESGPYRNFPYVETLATTTRTSATVTTFDARAVGRTFGTAVVDSMLTDAWYSLY